MKDGEYRLKKSVVFRNSMPEIMNKIREGATLKQIADEMGMKFETFRKYYQRFKTDVPVNDKPIMHDSFSHAKMNTEVKTPPNNDGAENESLTEKQKPDFETILDAEKRSGLNDKYLTQRKPIGKGKK